MIPDPNRAFRFTAAEMQARLPAQGGQRFAIALERGELQAEFYAPSRSITSSRMIVTNAMSWCAARGAS